MRWLALLALGFLAACSPDGAAPARPGSLTLTLTTGGASDGALVILVSGGPIVSVDGSPGYQVASNTDARGTHLMIVGNLTAGALATLDIADMSRASAYVVTVEQVADRVTFALLDPARDQVTVGPGQ